MALTPNFRKVASLLEEAEVGVGEQPGLAPEGVAVAVSLLAVLPAPERGGDMLGGGALLRGR